MKKLLVTSLSALLATGLVACTNKQDTPKDNTNTNPNSANLATDEVGYTTQYTTLYNNYLANLRGYSIYDNGDQTIDYYKNNNYPGNQEYVQNLKDAYNDSKTNIQKYIDGIKNDVKTTDKDLTDTNQKIINQGEQTISNIDEKLKKLDTIPQDAYNKSQDDFIRLVNETTKLGDDTKTNFNDLIKDLNKKLNINMDTNKTNVDQNKK